MRALLVMAIVVSAHVAHADEPAITCREAAPNSKLSVTFKPDTALRDLVLWVAGFSCKNIVVAPDVANVVGTFSVVAPKALTPKQALQLFVDTVESTGLVVQQKPDTIVIKLGPTMPKRCPTTSVAIPTTKPSTGDDLTNPFPPKAEAGDDDVAKKLAAGIKKLSATDYEVTRTLIGEMLLNPMAYAKGGRVVPAMKGGKPDGFKLYAIRPGSTFALLGLANGDTVQTVNGIVLTDAEKALEAYTKLRDAKRVAVGIVRGGKPMTLTYVIK